MDRQSLYYQQVQLLLKLIPFIAKHDCFALKGGTAINLFVRNLPRLSVDIDLVFLPVMERTESLKIIKIELETLANEIKSDIKNVTVIQSFQNKADALRLVIESHLKSHHIQVKIELSPVLRGTVHEPKRMQVSEAVEDEFGFAETLVVAFADLYAGKICAALDRQHPRDLFDVKQLLDNEGFDESLRKTLLVYIISHNRPIAELLQPKFKNIADIYKGEFINMTEEPISLAELETTREQLVKLINASITQEEKIFLLSFKNCTPDWKLLGLENIDLLPAVKWKLLNLRKTPSEKHTKAYNKLKKILKIN